MNEGIGVPLKEFAVGKKQPTIASLLGVTQGAVSQMLNSKRNIWVRECEGGGFQAVELRPVGSRRKPKAA